MKRLSNTLNNVDKELKENREIINTLTENNEALNLRVNTLTNKITEKEEEFENTRRNHQRALESMQASLEAEARSKAEALKESKVMPVENPSNGTDVKVTAVKVAAGTVLKNAAGQIVSADKVKLNVAKEGAYYIAQVGRMNAALSLNGVVIPQGSIMEIVEAYFADADGAKLNSDGTITISFNFPAGTSASTHKFTIYHLTDNGALEKFSPVVNELGLTVNVTSLSPFAIVAEANTADNSSTGSNTSINTGDSTNVLLYVVILSVAGLCGAAYVVYTSRRKKSKK